MTQYMTIPEAAVRWRTAPQSVRHACEVHRIAGAVRFGRSWLIPDDAQQPESAFPLVSGMTLESPYPAEYRYQARLRANRGEL